MHSELPFSQACENNKAPILEKLQLSFAQVRHVLEIGSGTGQHAVHFATHLPHLCWQASDQPQYVADLALRVQRAQLPNLPQPLVIDVMQTALLSPQVDAVFTANTLHIMSMPMVERFFASLNTWLNPTATLCIYGPFNYNGQFTSASNQAFDHSLKQRDPAMGIRDMEMIQQLAAAQHFQLQDDFAMPANNRLLWFKRNG